MAKGHKREMRNTGRVLRLIDRNVDDFYVDRKTHAEQFARNGILWDHAYALGVQEGVLTIIRERMH